MIRADEPLSDGGRLIRRTDGQATELAIFVHGLGARAKAWGALAELLPSDPRLRDFDFLFFRFPTSRAPQLPPVLRNGLRLPDVEMIASALAEAELTAERLTIYDGICVVSHSLGGGVVAKWATNQARPRSPQISTIVLSQVPEREPCLAKAMNFVYMDSNPQIRYLAKAIGRDMVRLEAEASSAHWNLIYHTGLTDGWVPKPLAIRVREMRASAGGHSWMSTIHHRADQQYRMVVAWLLDAASR